MSNPVSFSFKKPVKRILSQDDMDLFKSSSTKENILGFIKDLNQSVVGLTNDTEIEGIVPGTILFSIIGIMNKVEALLVEHPAQDQTSSRFGKPEFRDFYDDIQKHSNEWINTLFEETNQPQYHKNSELVDELSTYFNESWGNRQRIDYGSGHELNFICFLLCLNNLNLFKSADYSAIILKIFVLYLRIMREIQTMYWLEPAGSHGVWGLDDYHFLPFLFGSAQLSTHKHLRPISIHDKDIVNMYYKKYMYLGCIKFINDVKTASLRWHSPLIDDISGVKKWTKVNEGMIKMYDAEVLGKLPIMQHFMFGTLIPAPDGISPEGEVNENTDEHGHIHIPNTWADCCGIKVPSAIAASEMGHTGQLRKPIPFD